MRLHLAGELRDLEANPEDGPVSRHTGRLLRKVRVEFRAGQQLWDRLDDELHAAADEDEPGLQDADGVRWRVGTWSNVSASGSAARKYEVELTEIEEVEPPTAIEFLGLEFQVDYYQVRLPASGTGILLVEFTANKAEVEALIQQIREKRQSDDPYFELVRKGGSLPPVSVRFGRPVWEAAADGGRKFQLVFVLEDGDEDRDSTFLLGEPEASNVQVLLREARATLDALMSELRVAGVLSEEAISRIEEHRSTAPERGRLEYMETDDISAFR